MSLLARRRRRDRRAAARAGHPAVGAPAGGLSACSRGVGNEWVRFASSRVFPAAAAVALSYGVTALPVSYNDSSPPVTSPSREVCLVRSSSGRRKDRRRGLQVRRSRRGIVRGINSGRGRGTRGRRSARKREKYTQAEIPADRSVANVTLPPTHHQPDPTTGLSNAALSRRRSD